MKYKVTKKFGKYKVGSVVDDRDLYIRRKLQEGGCLEPFEVKVLSIEVKAEKKMVKESYENKMLKDDKKENKEEDK